MILTLTPNPSLDLAFDLVSLDRGGVNRAEAAHVHAGGKGINVSRALIRHRVSSMAVLPIGGLDGRRLVGLLGERGVPAVPVPVAGDTRVNVTISEADGSTTKVNAPGPVLSHRETEILLAAVDQQLATRPRYLVGAGSLPAGVGEAFFVRVAELAGQHGVPFALDTSGAPLAAAVRGGRLALVKPNDAELAELAGRELRTVADVLTAADQVLLAGTEEVLVSLGANGALLVNRDGCWWAGGDQLVPVSTVGAGDVTLAGYLAADGPPAERLRNAVAWGRAAVLMPGSAVPGPDDVDQGSVRVVEQPDPSLTLDGEVSWALR